MFKTSLIEKAINIFEREDYITCQYHGCFDIAAKKKKILFLKILQNVDAIQREQAKNLKILSNNLDAQPLLVGTQTRREKLQKGIVYERFDLPTLSIETLEDLISYEIFPKTYRDKGGLYVEIDSSVLREARKNKNLTQRELAELIGINKKTIYEHEKHKLRMLLVLAERLESVLERKLIKNTEFKKYTESGEPEDNLEKIVGNDLNKLGFKIDFVKQTPFDVIAKEKVLLISDIETDKRKIKYRSKFLKKFISFIKKPGVVITEKEKPELDIPILERKELEELSSKELIRIAKKH